MDIFFPLDDAYIVQHVVDGLILGAESRYADSTPMTGATSPLFVLLVYALAHIFEVTQAQLTVVIGSLVAYLWGVYRFARVSGLSALLSALITFFALLFGHSFYQLLNGLETGLAMAVVIWTCYLFRDGYPYYRWSFVILGLMPFVRPELGVLGLVVFAYALYGVRGAANSNRLALLGLGYAITGAAVVMLFLFWTSGSLIPNTLGAKVYFFAEGCLPFFTKLSVVASAFTSYAAFAGMGVLGVFGLAVSRLKWVAIAFFVMFFVAYVLRFPGALFHNHYRYVHLLFPLIVVGWISLLSSNKGWLAKGSFALFLVALSWSALGFSRVIADYQEGMRISRVELKGVADWVAEHVPELDSVLVHDAGFISLVGKQPLVDLVGLKSPSSVEAHRKYTWTRCGRAPEAIDEIASKTGASYFVVLDDWDRIFRLTDSLRYMGWHVERADSQRGATKYHVYQITVIPTKTLAPINRRSGDSKK